MYLVFLNILSLMFSDIVKQCSPRRVSQSATAREDFLWLGHDLRFGKCSVMIIILRIHILVPTSFSRTTLVPQTTPSLQLVAARPLAWSPRRFVWYFYYPTLALRVFRESFCRPNPLSTNYITQSNLHGNRRRRSALLGLQYHGEHEPNLVATISVLPLTQNCSQLYYLSTSGFGLRIHLNFYAVSF